MTPNAVDLIRLADIKAWLNSSGDTVFPTSSNDLYSRIVSSVSQFATSYLQRSLQPKSYTEVRNGTGSHRMMLKNRPILSVTSVQVGNTIIVPRSSTSIFSAGYSFDDSMIYLTGFEFCRGAQNVAVTYTSGFQASDAVSVPAVTADSPTPIVSTWNLSSHWNSDGGVSYVSSGLTFTRVTTAPSVAGTYMIQTDSGRTAEYVFAPADAAASVTITYGYTPEDIVQALVELAGQRIKARNRIGENSQALGPSMMTSFSQSDIGPTVKTILNQYRNVVPVT